MTFQGWDAFQMIDLNKTVILTLGGTETLLVKAAWHTQDFGTPDLVLPAQLTTVASEAFRGIAASRVSVPSGCTLIESGAFADIDHPLYIRIPASCTVQDGAFAGCERVYIFAPHGSSAEAYCQNNHDCVYVYWSQSR